MKVRDLVSFNGRVNRGIFWAIWFVIVAGNIAWGEFAGPVSNAGSPSRTVGFLVVLWVAFCLWVFAAAVARRFHDIDRPGWWALLMLVPLINVGVFLMLGSREGSSGPNTYGDDPLTEEPSPLPNRTVTCPQCGVVNSADIFYCQSCKRNLHM